MRTVLLRVFSIVVLVLVAGGCRDARSPLAPGTPAPAASAVTIASLAIAPGEIDGGSPAVGTATLSGPAPASGATVALSSDTDAAVVPASVAVSPGATTATFTVTTSVVTTATDTTITGSLGGVSRSATLRIGASAGPSQPGGPLGSFGTTHDDVIGGDKTQGTITLAAPAPAAGLSVRLASSDPTAVEVPSTVMVAPGATRATFEIETLPVGTERVVTLTATVTSARGVRRASAATLEFVLRVLPSVPVLTSITPAQGVQGTSVGVTLLGTGFTSGATIAVSGAGVIASDVVVASLTSVSATLAVDAAAAIGARTVTVTAAGGTSGGQTFTVTASNAAPVAEDDSYATTEATAVTIASPGVLANDTDPDGNALTASLVDDVDEGALTLNPDGSFTYTPDSAFNGTDSFTYRAGDGMATSNIATVTLTVDAVNDAPSFTAGANQTVDEDSGEQTINGWATGISPGPSNESSQTVGFLITGNTNTALFSAGPAVSSSGVLTYTPADDAAGAATITLHAVDDGGTANGGDDDSATQQFTITVNQLIDDETVFDYTGANQTFAIPDGITQIEVEAFGADGGAGAFSASSGGDGGSVEATIVVTPGDTLTIRVGGAGGHGGAGGAGGFNGGGAGGLGSVVGKGGGGGGASDVRQGGDGVGSRIIVAGGGGGTGGNNGGSGVGGVGGGLIGGNGVFAGGGGLGTGGSQGAGGAGGAASATAGCGGNCTPGSAGASGAGGNGGDGFGGGAAGGGGGGGGYFGGGGGGGSTSPGGGGGGGGSSWVDPAVLVGVATHQQGVRTGNGRVTIRW